MIYVCPECKDEYKASPGEIDQFADFICPNCESDISFEGNEKKEKAKCIR